MTVRRRAKQVIYIYIYIYIYNRDLLNTLEITVQISIILDKTTDRHLD